MCSANYSNLSPWLILPELETKGFPSIQQTAYQCGVSCEDATFAVYETLTHLAQNGNTVFQTFHDLEKAFDSIEYYILLKHLYSSGIHGKCWRIIQSFYDRPKGHVKVNGCLSPGFLIERGVRQGSVLSPTLFLVLIDSLLQKLKGANAGVALECVFLGSLGHADDIRSLTCDPQSSNTQAAIVNDFLAENFLQMNTQKCELLIHSHGSVPKNVQLEVGSATLKPTTASKCLGTRGTKVALSFFKALSRPLFGDRLCPHFNLSIEQDRSYLEHLVQTHQELHLGPVGDITDILVSASPSIICIE